MGPLGSSDGKSLEEIKARLLAAKSAASSVKLRTQFAKLSQELRKANDYSSLIIETRMSEKLNDAILREMEKQI